MKKTDEQIKKAAEHYAGSCVWEKSRAVAERNAFITGVKWYQQALSDMQEEKGDVEELKKQLLNIIQATDTCFAHTDEQIKYCDKNCEGYGCPVWLTTRDQIFNFFLPYLHQPDKDWEKYAAAFAEWIFKEERSGNLWSSDGNETWVYFKSAKGEKMTGEQLLSLFKESEEYKQLIK